jgi:hypothetical protein
MILATMLDDIGTLIPIIATIVGVGVVYLRLALKNELTSMRSQIYDHLDAKYFGRDILSLRLQAIEERLKRLENGNHNKYD